MNRFTRKSLSSAFFLSCAQILLVAPIACNGRRTETSIGGDGQVLQRVVLMLNWYPEAEHGGFYAAQMNGIYERYGLDVEIRSGGPNAPVVQELLTGRIDFAIGNADDVLLFRQEKAPVVALMAPIQNTPRCVLVHSDSSAADLKQLAGMTLQANVGRPFLNFLESRGMLRGVRVVPYSGNVANFIADKSTAIQAYSFSEPFLAQQEGVSSRCLMLSEIGFNPYASCLIATESTIAKREDVVSRMVAASREGWIHYLEQPSLTNQRIQELNKHGMTSDALEFGANSIKELCLPDGMPAERLGEMTAERWGTLYDQFVEMGLVDPSRFQSESVFANRFLE